jgi:hypothetical protein
MDAQALATGGESIPAGQRCQDTDSARKCVKLQELAFW